MPESAERSAEQKRLAREAARRREAVGVLRIIEATARYAATQMSNGAAPGMARAVALEAAAEGLSGATKKIRTSRHSRSRNEAGAKRRRRPAIGGGVVQGHA